MRNSGAGHVYHDSMKQKTLGELAFEEYLSGHGIAFEYEPPLTFTNKVIDYVVDHATHGQIYFEVEDIERSPFEGMGSFFTFDPSEPLLAQIGDGQKKFKSARRSACSDSQLV